MFWGASKGSALEINPYSVAKRFDAPCTIALNSVCIGNLTHNLSVAETFDEVVVYHSGRLHVGIHDRRPDEAKAAVFEILAECLGFGRSRRNLADSFPAVQLRLPTHEPPAVGIKVPELFLNLERERGLLTAASIFMRLRMMFGSANRV